MRTGTTRGRASAMAVAGLVGPLLVVGAGTATATTGPNLVVTKVTADRTELAEGDTFGLSFTVRNKGTEKARSSVTRFYLTRDWTTSLAARKASRTAPRSAPLDVLLEGASPTTALAAAASTSTTGVEVTVPVGTQPGRYTLLACADDTGRRAEGNEADNCLPAGGPLTVAAPEGNETLVLQQFGDTAPWPDEDEESWDLELVQSFCTKTVAYRAMSLTEAVSSTRRFLERAAGADAMRMLDTSGEADDPVAAQELAGVAVVKGVPGLALAAMLRAHELEPTNAGHLINAAGLAVSVGLPNQALAMLDASVSGELRRGAMGISQQAISLVVRGEALLMTGRLDAAEAMFEAAQTAEPMLSESEAGLAHVEACRGNDGAALEHMREGRQRSQGEPDVPGARSGTGRPVPALDYDNGVATPLRQLPLAGTPAQLLKMRPYYGDIENRLMTELDKQVQEELAIEERIRQGDESRTPAEVRRRDSILGLVAAVSSEVEIMVRSDEAQDQISRVMEVGERFFVNDQDGGDPTYTRLMNDAYEACDGSEVVNCFEVEMNRTCRPALTQAHALWANRMTVLQEMLDDLMTRVSTQMSTYASNLSDPDAHRLAILAIERYERDLYAFLGQQADGWSGTVEGVEEQCVDPLPAEIINPDGPTPGQTKGPCGKAMKAQSWVAAFGAAKVKVSCEKVTLTGSWEAMPLLAAFAEVAYDRRTGKTTVFAGSKGSGKLGGIVEGGFKSGIYITSDANGQIVDVGWRVGPSASVNSQAGEFKVYEDLVDISFVPVFTNSTNDSGLSTYP